MFKTVFGLQVGASHGGAFFEVGHVRHIASVVVLRFHRPMIPKRLEQLEPVGIAL